MAAAGVPTADGPRLHDPRRGRGRARRVRGAVRRQGRRAGRRQGRRGDRRPRRPRWPTPPPASGCVVEEFLDGPEVSLFARHRRRDGLPAAAGPGLQADLRRRRRPEHRRHGRLHARCRGRRPDLVERGAAHRAAADRRRDGPPRHAVQRAAVRRPRAHRARPPRGRVQRPLRRPRDPAAAGAPRLAARRSSCTAAADGTLADVRAAALEAAPRSPSCSPPPATPSRPRRAT